MNVQIKNPVSVGCIGCGKMGGAIMSAVAANPNVALVKVSDKNFEQAQAFAKKVGSKVQAVASNSEAASCDVLFLAVKPAYVGEVISEVSAELADGKPLVSMAAGVTLARLDEFCGERKPAIVRIMPNLPALVGQSMTGLCSKNAGDEAVALAMNLLGSCGKVERVDEKLMDGVTAVSGSGPAYVFMFIEALADAAVKFGIPRAQAYVYAAQTVKGAAQMILETGMSPAALKDDVCSPAGTTIEAVAALEECGMRSAIIKAATAAYEKSRGM